MILESISRSEHTLHAPKRAGRKCTRILIIDSHPFFRRGVRAALEMDPGLSVCAEAANEAAALTCLARHRPHVAIVDISRGRDAIEMIRRIREADARVGIVALSATGVPGFSRKALKAGASAFVPGVGEIAGLVAAVRRVRTARRPARPKGASPVGRTGACGRCALEDWELEMALMTGMGLPAAAIAVRLKMARATVESRLRSLRCKLQCVGPVEFVRACVRLRENAPAG